jgi:hypothetical protein
MGRRGPSRRDLPPHRDKRDSGRGSPASTRRIDGLFVFAVSLEQSVAWFRATRAARAVVRLRRGGLGLRELSRRRDVSSRGALRSLQVAHDVSRLGEPPVARRGRPGRATLMRDTEAVSRTFPPPKWVAPSHDVSSNASSDASSVEAAVSAGRRSGGAPRLGRAGRGWSRTPPFSEEPLPPRWRGRDRPRARY